MTRRARILAAALVLALALGAYAVFVRPEFAPRRFGEVVAGKVYRSGRLSPGALTRLNREHHFRTIVDFGAWEPGSPEELREQRTAQALGIDRRVFRLEGDSRGDPNAYVQALRLMRDPNAQPVLVHCSAGSERTGCAVMLYRTIDEGASVEDAYREAQRYDHDPDRNPHLMETFRAWKDPIREALRTGSPVPYPPR